VQRRFHPSSVKAFWTRDTWHVSKSWGVVESKNCIQALENVSRVQPFMIVMVMWVIQELRGEWCGVV
jgi:hypothetical protein